MKERIQKALARAGVASRRACEEIVREGRVTVDGEMVVRPGTIVDAETQDIRVDGARIRAERHVYWLVNKPRGYLCTASDPEHRRRVTDLVPDRRHRLFPVGRLDEDSEGLIIVTNDGALAQMIAHPRHEVEKVYDLSVRGDISPAAVKKVESGIWLSEGRTGPARMRIKRRGKRVSHVVVTIREGRNREIRRMFARVEHPVISLRRIQIGPVRDPRLKTGACRRLKPEEIEELRAAARGESLPPRKGKGRPRGRPARKKPAAEKKAPAKRASSAKRKPAGKASPAKGKPRKGPGAAKGRSSARSQPSGPGRKGPAKGMAPAKRKAAPKRKASPKRASRSPARSKPKGRR